MKKIAMTLTLAMASLFAGCLGPNHLHDGIRNWNAEATSHDWLNEGIFLGLTIIPVYHLAYLGDALFFNTWDYWAGENLLDDPGEFPDDSFTNED